MSEQKGSADFFEFMQNMWNPMGFTTPGMVPPTVDLAAIEKKITELKAVEAWLLMSTSMVQMTLKTLEVQRAGLEALQAGNKKPT